MTGEQLYGEQGLNFDVYSISYGSNPCIIEYWHVYLILYDKKSCKFEYR